ncbi:hypothetical protein cypCar_00017090 [Cyprinus carpio]|nr:hypothetical protein cypCar_00017090 [Cyprinus carpio]
MLRGEREVRIVRQGFKRKLSKSPATGGAWSEAPPIALQSDPGRTYQKHTPNRHTHTAARAMHPATAKWYDRRDCVFIEFLVEDSKDVNVNFEKSKFGFSCLSGTDNMKYSNEIDLFESINQDGSKHRRTDRSILCCLQKAESGKSWPRLTKDKAKASSLNWLSVDFNNWKDWEDDSDEDLSNYDRFSEMMGNMGGEDDLPDLDGADDKCQIWNKRLARRGQTEEERGMT